MRGLRLRVKATVTLTAREWQIYTSLAYDPDPAVRARLDQCVEALNSAASEALSTRTRSEAREIFWRAQNEYADVGASDTEPTTVFERLVERVYGQ